MGVPSERDIMSLFEIGKSNNSSTMSEIAQYFGIDSAAMMATDLSDIDNIGLHLQVLRKTDRMNVSYIHGHIIHFALEQYMRTNPDLSEFNIFETGTARGFSSVVMAHTLNKNGKSGIINTFDIKHQDAKSEGDCLCAAMNSRKVSAMECLAPFKDLVTKYIKFNVGDSNKILKTRQSERIHFAFLDGDHRYSALLLELTYVDKYQQSGDVIVVDDYSIDELKRATDEFLERGAYAFHVLCGKVGNKTRQYVHLVKK